MIVYALDYAKYQHDCPTLNYILEDISKVYFILFILALSYFKL